MRKRKMMRRRKRLMNELGFFTLAKRALFIKNTLMGLCRSKVHSISTGFYILPRADDKEASTYQEKRYIQKKRRKKGGKYPSRSTAYLVLDSGAYVIRKEEKNH
jgi:hypothetical protein